MSEAGALLCVFAHQDDEYGAATWIARESRRGRRVVCVFLTNGAATTPSEVRDRESRAVLTRLGVSSVDILFLGSQNDIPDGGLVTHLFRALALLERATNALAIDEILTLAWEGGHHDHDAAHLVALALARRRSVSCLEYPLYRKGAGPLFRVLAPLRNDGSSIRLTFREGWRGWALAWRYRSQLQTWIGLLPGSFAGLVLQRRVVVSAADSVRVLTPPHSGPLLYERRFGMPWARFAREARPFIDAHVVG